jgi:hypothetical protein
VIQVVGTADINGTPRSRLATAPASGNLCPRDPPGQVVTQLLLAATGKPPLAIELVDKNRQRAVHRGTTYPAEFRIKRQAGFRGEVLLQMAARQSRHRQGITGPVLAVAADAERALYPCFLPEWLETDRTTRMVVLGLARVADPQGTPRWLAVPADARVTMILEGALLKVSHEAEELTVRGGEAFQLPVEVSRSAKLPVQVEVELVVPTQLQGLVEAAPVVLAAGQRQGVLRVRTAADAQLSGRWTLQVRAAALQDQRWPVVSQADVAVEFVAPPTGGGE